MIGLVHLDFNLTNACNLACSHCHSASGKALPNELTTEEIIDVTRQAHAMGALTVAFAGGEPFMRRDILTILAAACALPGWRVSVITNGLFLTDRMLARLAEECPGLMVNVSIDGADPDSFGLLRAQPNATPAAKAALFRRVVDGVARTVQAGMTVSVNTTLTKATIGGLASTYELAVEELGAQSLVAIKFFPAGYGRDHLDRFDFSAAEWSVSMRELTEARLAGRFSRMQLSLPSAWEFYLPLIEGGFDLGEAERAWHMKTPLREPVYARSRSVGDVAGVTEICVDGDGSVYPTVLMVGDARMRCGSVREDSLAGLWAQAPTLTGLRAMSLTDIRGGCADCELSTVCGGGSRSRAFVESGDIRAADLPCPLVAR